MTKKSLVTAEYAHKPVGVLSNAYRSVLDAMVVAPCNVVAKVPCRLLNATADPVASHMPQSSPRWNSELLDIAAVAHAPVCAENANAVVELVATAAVPSAWMLTGEEPQV